MWLEVWTELSPRGGWVPCPQELELERALPHPLHRCLVLVLLEGQELVCNFQSNTGEISEIILWVTFVIFLVLWIANEESFRCTMNDAKEHFERFLGRCWVLTAACASLETSFLYVLLEMTVFGMWSL